MNINLHTQKAKGVFLLKQCRSHASNLLTLKPPSQVIFMSAEATSEPIKFPAFARPCPMRPRHGFVESRLVRNMDELMRLWAEARAADDGAEIMLMPRLSGRLSAVANASGVAWGKGHDGATSGNGAISIPCPGDHDYWNSYVGGNNELAGIKSEGWLELVENLGDLYLVQLRDGPRLEANADYIPQDKLGMMVERIITIKDMPVAEEHNEALLHWESFIAQWKDMPGTVIALPGKTLASHFAVHGITSGLPVICSQDGNARLAIGKPLEGEIAAKPLGQDDYALLASHAEKVKGLNSRFDIGWIMEAIASLHACSIWGNERHLMKLRASMPVVLTRFMASAALGEMRHFSHVFHSGNFEMDFSDFSTSNRNSVYNKMFTSPWESLKQPLQFCASPAGFANEARRGGSYGGPKWARIARTAFRLHNQLEIFRLRPSKAAWDRVVKTCNIAVNLAHNGGNVFTKWLPQNYMDYMAVCPSIGYMNLVAGDHCLEIDECPMLPEACAISGENEADYDDYQIRLENEREPF